MGQKEKLIQRLKSKPKDFTFDDAETLLNYLDYIRSNKGKTSVPVSYSQMMNMAAFYFTNRTHKKN